MEFLCKSAVQNVPHFLTGNRSDVASTLEVRHVAPVPVGCRIRARVFLKELSEIPGGAVRSIREVVFERDGHPAPCAVIHWITNTPKHIASAFIGNSNSYAILNKA